MSTDKLPITFEWITAVPTYRTFQVSFPLAAQDTVPEKLFVWFRDSLGDPKVKVGEVVSNRFTHNTPNYSQSPQGHYTIEGIMADESSVMSEEFDVFHKGPDLYGDNLLLRGMFNGFTGPGNTAILVYPRRVFGKRCDCAPPGQGSYSNMCGLCLGTGFIGGYHAPVLAFIDFRNIDIKDRDHGRILTNETTSNVLHLSAGYYVPKAYDVVRELNPPMPVYSIQNVQVTKFNSRPIDSFCTVKQVDSGHPIYKVPFPQLTYVSRWGHYVKRLPDGTKTTFKDEYDKMVAGLQVRT